MSDGGLFIPVALSVSAGMTVLLVVAGVAALMSPGLSVQARVRALAEATSIYAPDAGTLLRSRRSGLGGMTYRLDRLVTGGAAETLERSGLPLRVGEYLAIRIVALVVGAVLGVGLLAAFHVGALLGGTVGMVGGYIVPPLVVRIATQRRDRAIERQLAELSDLVASMMRSGFGYLQALSAAAEEIGDPLSSELSRLLDAIRLGADVDESFAQLNRRLHSQDFDMIATAISIQRRSGGNLADILEGVATTIRNRQSFRQEVAALTSRERFSAVIIAVLPFALVLLLDAIDSAHYGLLFTDPRGQALLVLSIILDAVGYVIIRRISKVEV